MAILYHHPFCPNSRFVRLVMGELGMEPELKEERTWERRTEYLAMNPSGSTPALLDGDLVVPGAGVIAEYLNETRSLGMNGRRLLPQAPAERVEVRRLLDWFLGRFGEEVSGYLVTEKIFKRFMGSAGAAVRRT